MDRMFDQGSNAKESEAKRSEAALDALFAEYRSAFPDPDGGANFMPNLWRRIEARRTENVSVFRRLVQVCLVATAALTLGMALIIPRLQPDPVYSATYVDVLDAAHSNDSVQAQLQELDAQ